jgi:protein-S-isoprenylcysteine O-methyltransferase Ste14
MQQFLRFYLPIFILLNLLVTFVIPSVRVYRKTGVNPVTFGSDDNAHDYIGFIMKVLTGLLVVSVLIFSLSPKVYEYLVPIRFLNASWLAMIGLAIMHLAFIWTIVAQYHMRMSWRVGIDTVNKTDLITNGLFRISRNPIFLGMIVSVVGLFLTIPNALTLMIAFSTYILIQIQIRLEEDHLVRQHGQLYNEYRMKVNRLI